MTETDNRTLVAGLAAGVLVLVLLLVLSWAKYAALRAGLDTACGGVIANLDLTEWVSLCKR